MLDVAELSSGVCGCSVYSHGVSASALLALITQGQVHPTQVPGGFQLNRRYLDPFKKPYVCSPIHVCDLDSLLLCPFGEGKFTCTRKPLVRETGVSPSVEPRQDRWTFSES